MQQKIKAVGSNWQIRTSEIFDKIENDSVLHVKDINFVLTHTGPDSFLKYYSA